jgi:hypothetical protein
MPLSMAGAERRHDRVGRQRVNSVPITGDAAGTSFSHDIHDPPSVVHRQMALLPWNCSNPVPDFDAARRSSFSVEVAGP